MSTTRVLLAVSRDPISNQIAPTKEKPHEEEEFDTRICIHSG